MLTPACIASAHRRNAALELEIADRVVATPAPMLRHDFDLISRQPDAMRDSRARREKPDVGQIADHEPPRSP